MNQKNPSYFDRFFSHMDEPKDFPQILQELLERCVINSTNQQVLYDWHAGNMKLLFNTSHGIW